MEYLVMECGLSYAVVLDGQGRFLKVPNLGYEVGQTLDHVVLQEIQPQSSPVRKHFTRWAAMAACLCLMMLGSWGLWQAPVGTVRMQINPDIQMSVNRFDRVVQLEGLNEDGERLIEGYRSYGRELKAVSDELADRAVELGYLSDGGHITLTVESDREEWKTAAEELLLLELDVHLEHRVTVTAASSDPSKTPDGPSKPADMIVIHPEQVFPEPPEADDGNAEDDRDDDGNDDDDAWGNDTDDSPDDRDDDQEHNGDDETGDDGDSQGNHPDDEGLSDADGDDGEENEPDDNEQNDDLPLPEQDDDHSEEDANLDDDDDSDDGDPPDSNDDGDDDNDDDGGGDNSGDDGDG